MDPEVLRTQLLADADSIIELPLILRWKISDEQMKRVKALREYWFSASLEQLNALAAILARE